jgi:hypothetical protein
MVDKILSDEYPYSGYGFCINVGDQTTANSGISMFTLEGRCFPGKLAEDMGGSAGGKENNTDLAVDGSEGTTC